MDAQPTPKVTAEDVVRLLHREFGDEREQAAATLLARITEREAFRIQAAAIKVANRSLDGLLRAVEQANRDYRDLLVAAEYSASAILGWQAPIEAKQVAWQNDWDSYQAWFNRVD